MNARRELGGEYIRGVNAKTRNKYEGVKRRSVVPSLWDKPLTVPVKPLTAGVKPLPVVRIFTSVCTSKNLCCSSRDRETTLPCAALTMKNSEFNSVYYIC